MQLSSSGSISRNPSSLGYTNNLFHRRAETVLCLTSNRNMNRKQVFLVCLVSSALGAVLVQARSISHDAEQPALDGNRIDGPEESEATSDISKLEHSITTTTTTTSTTTPVVETIPTSVATATRAPHNYTVSVMKALEVMKSSFAQDLRFDTVKKARRFVKYAHLLPSYLAAMEADNQTENKELIGQMRKAMEEPGFKVGEQVSRKTMNKYRPLDRDSYKRPEDGLPEESVVARFSSSRYLRSLYLLASLKNKMDKDAAVKRILWHVYELKRPPMVESLLEYAINDTRASLRRSEAASEQNDKLGCQVEILQPICDITGTPRDSPQVPDAKELLKLKELGPVQMREKLGSAKVDVEVMATLCAGVRRNFKNIAMIRKYEKSKVLDEGQLANRLQQDPELNFYYQLYDLCSPTRIW